MERITRMQERWLGAPKWKVAVIGVALLISIAVLTITVGPGVISAVSSRGSARPTLPPGWTWYHDSVYPFDAPIPPGWQAHGYWNWIGFNNDKCTRTLDLVPPVTQPRYAPSPDGVSPEVVTLVIPTSCADFVPAMTDPHLKPSGAITIDGAKASVYMQLDEVGDQRAVIVRFGGRQYDFHFYYEYGPQTPQSGDAAQVALFNMILKNFTYHG